MYWIKISNTIPISKRNHCGHVKCQHAMYTHKPQSTVGSNVQLTSYSSVYFCISLKNCYSQWPVCSISRRDKGRRKNLYFTEPKATGIVNLQVLFISSRPRYPKVLLPFRVSNLNFVFIFNFANALPLCHLFHCLSFPFPPAFSDKHKSCSSSLYSFVHSLALAPTLDGWCRFAFFQHNCARRMTQICVFNTRLFSLQNILNYAIHRACLRMVLLTDVYRNPTPLWINL